MDHLLVPENTIVPHPDIPYLRGFEYDGGEFFKAILIDKGLIKAVWSEESEIFTTATKRRQPSYNPGFSSVFCGRF
jgi:hypothetical protein